MEHAYRLDGLRSSSEIKQPKRHWWLGWLIALLALFSYANQIIYRYVVPPGGDAINHNAVVATILNGNWHTALTYHIVWHLIVAGIALVTHARPITVMAWLGPALLVSGG